MLHRTLGVAFALGLGAAPIDGVNVPVASYADWASFPGAVRAAVTDDVLGLDSSMLGGALPHAVPEPSTLALFGLGVALVGIGFVRRRPGQRRRRKD